MSIPRIANPIPFHIPASMSFSDSKSYASMSYSVYALRQRTPEDWTVVEETENMVLSQHDIIVPRQTIIRNPNAQVDDSIDFNSVYVSAINFDPEILHENTNSNYINQNGRIKLAS